MSESTIRIEQQQYGLSITLNRPEKRNAMNAAMIQELTDAFSAIKEDSNNRYVLLQGADNCFCTGADLNWMKETANYSQDENLAEAQKLAKLLDLMFHCPIPLIAFAQGHAYGGAMGLLAVSDTVIAEPDTQFCLSEVKLGLIPATIYPYVLYKMGASRTAHLSLTATLFDSTQAHNYDLVHALGNRGDALKMAERVAKNSPAACQTAKKLMRRLKSVNPDYQMLTSEILAQVRASDEAQEGLQAFFDKRKPNWITDHD